MVQEILIFIIFIAAAAYMGRMLFRSFSSKGSGCVQGCGSACASIDFKKIQKDLEQKQLAQKTH